MTSYRPTIQGHNHMIAAGHYLATQAGHAVLEDGGNAVDAGVAAAMVLGVVQSDLVSVAGVAPIMIRTPDGTVTTISGVGRWPRAARIETFAEQHGGHIPRGVLRTVVPAAPDAFITALERWGTRSFGEVAAGAIRVAAEGFVMYPLMAESLAKSAGELAEWPSTAALYLPGGKAPAAGDVFRHPELAEMLRHMAAEERSAATRGRAAGLTAARRAFYEGDIAKTAVDFIQAQGGWLSRGDMAAFRVGVEDPITVRFRDMDLHCCGAWCQGPALAQMARIADRLDLEEAGHNATAYVHRLAEATKLAFADRELYLGDPETVDVPLDRLLSTQHAAAHRSAIRDDAVIDGSRLWQARGETPDGPGSALDTSYVAAADANGLVFSCTPSDGCTGTPVIPGLGVCFSSRGSQSWADPTHPSSVAPWKRPRLTPNPAIAVLDDGRVIPFGTPGADVQCQAMMQVLINRTVFGMSPQEAVEAPRFALYGYPQSFEPHESGPDTLRIEDRIDPETRSALASLGHRVEDWGPLNWRAGAVCMVEWDPAAGTFSGAADPRRPCSAMGF